MYAFVTRSLFALAMILISASVDAQSAQAVLTVDSERGSQSLSIDDLRGRLPTTEIEVLNPDLGRSVRYLTFALADVLKLMDAGDAEDLVFHCLDGYQSNTSAANVATLDLRLAYGEDGVPGQWSPIPTGKTMTNPAPFIVISANTSDAKTFSWPFQMNRIEGVSFARKFPLILPAGVSADSAIARGFTVFREQCLKCHSVNLQGGEVGPELNIPQNITEYRSTRFLRQWLRDPSQFRARARMPATQLTPPEIDEVIAYLRHMANHKQGR
ncbi:MAG TPA: cytochrome c [Accumulibacter sp.]|uniref:cytochrome c n=1 Tax=Accumulibacter sp. TaxID=2053492 RepID=UPI002CED74C5|nr:cytochrome c [Accumulibacter sp.]HRF73938.1 cytochrome c [Accumulibacter sp.]